MSQFHLMASKRQKSDTGASPMFMPYSIQPIESQLRWCWAVTVSVNQYPCFWIPGPSCMPFWRPDWLHGGFGRGRKMYKNLTEETMFPCPAPLHVLLSTVRFISLFTFFLLLLPSLYSFLPQTWFLSIFPLPLSLSPSFSGVQLLPRRRTLLWTSVLRAVPVANLHASVMVL